MRGTMAASMNRSSLNWISFRPLQAMSKQRTRPAAEKRATEVSVPRTKDRMGMAMAGEPKPAMASRMWVKKSRMKNKIMRAGPTFRL